MYPNKKKGCSIAIFKQLLINFQLIFRKFTISKLIFNQFSNVAIFNQFANSGHVLFVTNFQLQFSTTVLNQYSNRAIVMHFATLATSTIHPLARCNFQPISIKCNFQQIFISWPHATYNQVWIAIFTQWIPIQTDQCHLAPPSTYWGRRTHICLSKLTIIGSLGRRQAITWTNAGILLIGPLGTNFSEIIIRIQTFSFKKLRLKMASAKSRPFCLSLNLLNWCYCCTVFVMWNERAGQLAAGGTVSVWMWWV